MALAAEKTWNFQNYLYAYEEDVETMQRHWWFGIKDTLERLGWEVRGGLSSVGLFHNTAEAFGAYSGSDPWPTFDDANKTGSDMYVIMRAPCGAEICMGANYSSQTTYMIYTFMYFSPAAGFGSANGGANGTGGTSAVPPTATDQVEIYPHNSNSTQNGTDGGQSFSIYGAHSTDDLSTRLVIQRQRGLNLFLTLDHVNNPHPNLDNSGRVFSFRVDNGDEPTDSVMSNSFYTSALFQGRVSGVNRALYGGTSGYANAGHQSLNRVMTDKKMVVAPVDLYNNTLGERGYYGTIPDLYWGNNNHFMQLLGDSIGGAANWFSGGSLVSPWDPAEPMPRVY